MAKKPSPRPSTRFPGAAGELHRQDEWLWLPLCNEWRDVSAKPEEIVRQAYVRHLVEDFGYSLDQMDQERRTMHGHRSPRADIAVWESATAKATGK